MSNNKNPNNKSDICSGIEWAVDFMLKIFGLLVILFLLALLFR